ncbi:MAG: helix-turn-helix domain-containing protein [Marinobacter sp.]|uniref:helix-turn-helix domain-containing protein n=1 Tax=Marinobacter sp. TaxID=50741 RepID=UPI003297D94F
MDSLIKAAARALESGDPLCALNYVALRDDAHALALRGIAMAQLGEFDRARVLVNDAARAFGSHEPVARAKCVVAEAEIALASRDLGWPPTKLDAARVMLEKHGDRVNAAHARYIDIGRRLLLGRLDEAAQELVALVPTSLPPALRTVHELMVAGIAMRQLDTRLARSALEHAERASREAGIPALSAEVASKAELLDLPAARLITMGMERLLLLEDVEALLESTAFVVDACRYVVKHGERVVSLATRPVLFTLLRTLAEAWPDEVTRDQLIAQAFRTKRADDSHRVRLRVEIGRLRGLMETLADVKATSRGFVLAAPNVREVVVLARPVEEKYAALLALLSDGQFWSSSALALALGIGQRSVQRALDTLSAEGKVFSFGRGRKRRWSTPPIGGFATILLLPGSLPVH